MKWPLSLKLKNICILCTSTSNKLTRKALGKNDVTIHAAKLPIGKDGFLATNSLIATMIWLVRAYVQAHSLPYYIPRFAELDVHNEDIFKIQATNTLILLYDYWGKTAALDTESKMVEAGLANVQIADYRNFAHGRHNWLDKNSKMVNLLTLITPECELLAAKTLNLISRPCTSYVVSY